MNRGKAKQRNLKQVCFRAVRTHFDVIGPEGVLGLPTPLITDLLPHLTICQLDEIQPALNQRGISTYAGWIGILLDMCRPEQAVGLHTEEEAKHEVMKWLFTSVFYGFTNPIVKRNITNLNTPSFLRAAAKCLTSFTLLGSPASHKKLQWLTAEQRPLLNLFEKRIKTVKIVSNAMDLSKKGNQTALYIFHRLADHGVADRVLVHSDCPMLLAWILYGRGTQYVSPELMNLMHTKKASCISQDTSVGEGGASCSSGLVSSASEDREDEATPCKRQKISFVSSEKEEEEKSGTANVVVDPQILCQAFAPCDGPSAGTCPRGQIECLELNNCRPDSFRVLTAALPTFFCLRSLILHSSSTFTDSDVFSLAKALRRLSESSRSSLTDLSISALPYAKLMEVLLNASSKVTSLHVEIHTVVPCSRITELDTKELPLEKLTIKVTEVQTDMQVFTSLLRRCPNLTTLHVAGMRLPTGSSQKRLLTTLSEFNHHLKILHLEDMKLSDCLPEILTLLKVCKLEELRLNDCRLLEKWSDKEESLRQLVTAVKKVPSLHTLSLAQNRLARIVCVLSELFSGPSPSSVSRLNISSNFIQPAELLEFAETLKTHRPPHRLTLDLRKNPGDRDPDTWDTALKRLRPFGVVLVEGWVSTHTMADHISNM